MDEMEQPVEQLDSDAAAAAAEEHEQAADQDDQQANDPNSQEQPEEEDEIEVDGKKFVMPKSAAEKLKAERLMHADYTRKTQEVAATRQQVEAEREQVKQAAAQQQQFIKEVAKVHALDDQLEQFKQVDWDALSDQDPVAAQKLSFQYQKLQQARNEAAEAVTQKQNEHALAEERAFATQAQEAEAYVQREIPGWTPERANAVNQFALSQGLKLDQPMAKLIIQQPALIKLLDKAEKFDQLEKKQATKPKTPAPPPAPPTRVGAARASAKVDPAKIPTADWMEQRNKQLRSKR